MSQCVLTYSLNISIQINSNKSWLLKIVVLKLKLTKSTILCNSDPVDTSWAPNRNYYFFVDAILSNFICLKLVVILIRNILNKLCQKYIFLCCHLKSGFILFIHLSPNSLMFHFLSYRTRFFSSQIRILLHLRDIMTLNKVSSVR